MNTKTLGSLQDVEDILGSMDMTYSPVLAAKFQAKADQKIVAVAVAELQMPVSAIKTTNW
jgi:hypothetical protein